MEREVEEMMKKEAGLRKQFMGGELIEARGNEKTLEEGGNEE